MNKQIFFRVLLSVQLLSSMLVLAYTQVELDSFASRGKAFVEKTLKIREQSGDTKGAAQLKQLLVERFSDSGTRLSSGQVAMEAAPAGQAYILVPADVAQRYRQKGEGELQSSARGEVVLSSTAPTSEQQKQKPQDSDEGTWMWHLKEGKWVFISYEPRTGVRGSSTPSVPSTPTSSPGSVASPAAPAAPAVPTAVSAPAAPPVPQAPPVPTAPPVPAGGIPAAPAVPTAPPLGGTVPGAPEAPPIPGAPIAPPAPGIPGAPPPIPGAPAAPSLQGQAKETKPKKVVLTEEQVAALTADQKKASDQLYMASLVKASKLFPEKLTTSAYGTMVGEILEKLQDVNGIARTEAFSKLTKQAISKFFSDKSFKELQNFEAMKKKAVELFKGGLLNEQTEEFNQAVERLVIGGFGVARAMGEAKKPSANEQVISDNAAYGAILKSDDVESLRQSMLKLIVDSRFYHFAPLLRSWYYDPAELAALDSAVQKKEEEKRKTIALMLLENPYLPTTIIRNTIWNNLFFASGETQTEETKEIAQKLDPMIDAYKKVVKERKQVTTQPQESAVAFDLNAELSKLWPQIKNLIELKNALGAIAKKAGPTEKTGLNALVTLLSKQPENQEEFKKQFAVLFKNKENEGKVANLYQQLKVYFDVIAVMKQAKTVAEAKKKEADKMASNVGKENETRALREQVFQGKWLYIELTKIFKSFFHETVNMFNSKVSLTIEWALPAIEKGIQSAEAIDVSTENGRVLKEQVLNRLNILRATVVNAQNKALQQTYTNMYRNHEDVFGSFSEFFTKNLVTSFKELNFEKSYFLMILEPYGVVLKIIDEFNSAKQTAEDYKILVQSLKALDKSIEAPIILANKSDYFPAVVTFREQIVPPVSLYKGLLTEIIKALEESHFGRVKDGVDQLVSRAGVGVEKRPEYEKLMSTFQTQLIGIFRTNIISGIELLDQGNRVLEIKIDNTKLFKSKLSLIQAYVGQAIIGTFTSLINYIKSKKNLEEINFSQISSDLAKIVTALKEKIAAGLKKAGEDASEEQVNSLVEFIVDNDLLPLYQRLGNLYQTVSAGKKAPPLFKSALGVNEEEGGEGGSEKDASKEVVAEPM